MDETKNTDITQLCESFYESSPMVKVICEYTAKLAYEQITKQHKKELKMLTETLKALCTDGCKDGGCYRFFTCNSWPNSRLYAVGPTKIWFDKLGRAKIKDSGNYELSNCLDYCNRKRDPWREVKTMNEVKALYV